MLLYKTGSYSNGRWDTKKANLAKLTWKVYQIRTFELQPKSQFPPFLPDLHECLIKTTLETALKIMSDMKPNVEMGFQFLVF